MKRFLSFLIMVMAVFTFEVKGEVSEICEQNGMSMQEYDDCLGSVPLPPPPQDAKFYVYGLENGGGKAVLTEGAMWIRWQAKIGNYGYIEKFRAFRVEQQMASNPALPTFAPEYKLVAIVAAQCTSLYSCSAPINWTSVPNIAVGGIYRVAFSDCQAPLNYDPSCQGAEWTSFTRPFGAVEREVNEPQ